MREAETIAYISTGVFRLLNHKMDHEGGCYVKEEEWLR